MYHKKNTQYQSITHSMGCSQRVICLHIADNNKQWAEGNNSMLWWNGNGGIILTGIQWRNHFYLQMGINNTIKWLSEVTKWSIYYLFVSRKHKHINQYNAQAHKSIQQISAADKQRDFALLFLTNAFQFPIWLRTTEKLNRFLPLLLFL